MTLEQALSGKDIPQEIREKLRLLDVVYLSFDGKIHSGQIVVHEEIAERVALVFEKFLELRFPIHKVVPASVFGGDDAELMKQNITSGQNFRTIKNTSVISAHGYGLAFDINPLFNPCFYKNGEVDPPHAYYDPERSGTLTPDGEAVRFIESLGFTWGGRWKEPVDTGHVEDRKLYLKLSGREE